MPVPRIPGFWRKIGNVARRNVGVADGQVPLMDATGYPAADGSQITGLARGHIDGLILSNNGTDAAHDIDIAPGEATDDGNAIVMPLASTLVKQIDASWAVGTNAGGLDGTESVAGVPDADTWYHVWLIRRSDTGVVDALFSESATAPTMPTNYDQKRRIGAVLTDVSANIISFSQNGDEFRWKDRRRDVSAAPGVTTGVLATMSTPLGIQVAGVFLFSVFRAAATQHVITSPDETDTVPSVSFHDLETQTSGTEHNQTRLMQRTNTSSQIRHRSSVTTMTQFFIDTLGWIDPRGRNA